MISPEIILAQREQALDSTNLTKFGPRTQGKVRDIYSLQDGTRLLVTTDRQSAFDRVLGLIPFKGQVLNQLSAFWFDQTRDIVANHMLDVPDPNVMHVREADMFPIEIIVRGYLTGVTDTSIWTLYQKGQRNMYGLDFPDGMQKNQPLPQAVITPTTHAAVGAHDRPLSKAEILAEGMVDPDLYNEVEQAALAVFARGQEICAQAGLILVDTKYEFGLIDGKVALTDEVHTPDSSRFWLSDTYSQRFESKQEPESFDKELLRLWLKQQGYNGEGEPPPFDDDITVRMSQRYIACYERITGQEFQIDTSLPATERVEQVLNSKF